MHVLLITQEPPFNPAQVATGNSIRTKQLREALEQRGHSTRQVWLAGDGQADPDSFQHADKLRSIIRSEAPGAILVSYWKLLALLPLEPEQPVILDFVAPRPLEELFENPQDLGANLHRLRARLAQCDLLLTGNREQEKLLTYWLLEAGFDLREGLPVCVVPPGAEALEPPVGDPEKDGWTLVGGGVTWPWRDSSEFMEAVRRAEQQHAGQMRLVLFGGKYRWHEGETNQSGSGDWDMAAYADYSAFLSGSAHIGLELSNENIERRYSQSFRSLDFLRHGLPLICNDWLPIAGDIKRYEAGWTISSANELEELLAGIIADPEDWKRRSANALKLVRETLDPARSAQELLNWLDAPAKARRLQSWGMPPGDEPVLGIPPWPERLKRRYRLARRILLNRVFAKDSKENAADAIVMVSRGDIFPTDHGAAVKIVETARGLSRNGRAVGLVTDDRRSWWLFQDGDCKQMPLPAWLRLLARPLAWVKLDHYTKDIPESNAFLYLPLSDGSFFWRTLYVAGRLQARVLQAEFPAYALPCIQAGEILDAAVCLVEHNVEYARLQQQVPELTDEQFRRFRSLEIDLCNRSDAVVCVSDNDRQRLVSDGVHPGLLHTIPHGIDLQACEQATPLALRDKFDIPADAPLLAYHGTFAYPPNREALQVLAEEILPRLEAVGINAHVLAVGHKPPRESLHPRLHCTGSVENVAPALKAADLAVIPLLEGGGTRMKIIDYYAAGLPVVSTSKGIEGIPAVHREQAMITDDWDEMSAAVVEVLEHPDLAAALALAGRTIASDLDWQAIGRRYLKVYAGISN